MSATENSTFLAAYQELVALTDDNPKTLTDVWERNPRLVQLSLTLYEFARTVDVAEAHSQVALTPNVPPVAIKARRDFDQRWKRAVAHVALMQDDLHRLINELWSDKGGEREEPVSGLDEEREQGKREAGWLEAVFDHLSDQAEIDPEGLDWAQRSLETWKRLKGVSGLDIAGAFWRRRALPHVLVPSHVAAHYGQRRASLYRRWHEAATAFVFGAPLAALALQRACMEELLEAHWNAERGAVANADLPEPSWQARASRLKRMANEVLHRDLPNETPEALDEIVLQHFALLRELIEQAPHPARR